MENIPRIGQRLNDILKVLKHHTEALATRCSARAVSSANIEGTVFGAKNDRVVGYQ